jgi:hypothetical protein
MKVSIKHIKCDMTKEDKVLTKKFIAFLQTKYPLRNDLKINFLGVRDGEMSTGSRTMDSTLKILSKHFSISSTDNLPSCF